MIIDNLEEKTDIMWAQSAIAAECKDPVNLYVPAFSLVMSIVCLILSSFSIYFNDYTSQLVLSTASLGCGLINLILVIYTQDTYKEPPLDNICMLSSVLNIVGIIIDLIQIGKCWTGSWQS
jgi:hypothetical protein